MVIETKNLKLIPCDAEILKSAIEGNETLAKKLHIHVQENWTTFGIGALKYALEKLQEGTVEKNWWTYLPVLKHQNLLIGSGGYKGAPDADGMVEIGYEITIAHQNHGYATEFARGLVENAFQDDRVKSIVAHTLGEVNPSTRVLSKCGFEKVDEMNDPEDGLIWKWELKKGQYDPSLSHS